MDEIVNVIGTQAALKLSESFGGMSLYIGKVASVEITHAIGQQAAFNLSAVYDGCCLYIPNAKAAKLAVRNELIRSDRVNGAGIRELVAKYQLSDRRIFSICA
jgi:Mor family transcriptional regulator